MNQKEIDMIRLVEKLTRNTISRHWMLTTHEKELVNSIVAEMAEEIIQRGMKLS